MYHFLKNTLFPPRCMFNLKCLQITEFLLPRCSQWSVCETSVSDTGALSQHSNWKALTQPAVSWLRPSCKKCLLDVQTSHLLLMASNRNSICDIWSHKTINSDREIVNSTSRAVFPFQTSTSFQLQFWPPVSIGPNWEVCNGLQSVQLGVEDFYVTEMKISTPRIHWSKREWDCKEVNIWMANICDQNTGL